MYTIKEIFIILVIFFSFFDSQLIFFVVFVSSENVYILTKPIKIVNFKIQLGTTLYGDGNHNDLIVSLVLINLMYLKIIYIRRK